MKWWKIGLLLVVEIVIVVLAGVLFHYLEHDLANKKASEAMQKIQNFRDAHACLGDNDLTTLHTVMNEASILKIKYFPDGFKGTSWDYQSSVYSALQVVSTVGFGSSPPKSLGGKIFVVIYAILGIPLFISVTYGCGVQLLAISDWIRRCFWKSAGVKDYVMLHVVRTFIMFIIGFLIFSFFSTLIFKIFDPNLDFWNTVASNCVVYIGPGEFTPVNLSSITLNRWYRLFVGVWSLCYILYFWGVQATTFRIIIAYYNEKGTYIPNSFTFMNRDMAIVSRVWVNQKEEDGEEGDDDGGKKNNIIMKLKNIFKRKKQNNIGDVDGGGGDGWGKNDGGGESDASGINDYGGGGVPKFVNVVDLKNEGMTNQMDNFVNLNNKNNNNSVVNINSNNQYNTKNNNSFVSVSDENNINNNNNNKYNTNNASALNNVISLRDSHGNNNWVNNNKVKKNNKIFVNNNNNYGEEDGVVGKMKSVVSVVH